jgi:hypothetical protein
MKTFLAIFNTLPAILQSVQAVESALPLPQAGQQKMNLILAAAAAAWEIGQAIEQQVISKSTTVSAVQSLTNVTVSSLNAAGVLTPAAAPAPVSSK